MAGITDVPVIIREMNEAEMMQISMIENLQRENLNPVEEALGYRTLSEEYGLTQDEISKSVGKSRPVIANAMRLLKLPQVVLDMVKEGEISSGHARALLAFEDEELLIQTAEMQGKRKEFEKFLSMLAQKVRSLGIHLIIATQRPSANIVTGVLKANIPYRISFRLPSHTDSQTILDMSGAENLLGKGDMLLVTDSETIRMQGLYISENELDKFVKSR